MHHLSPSFEYQDMTHGFNGARLSGQISSLAIMCIYKLEITSNSLEL